MIKQEEDQLAAQPMRMEFNFSRNIDVFAYTACALALNNRLVPITEESFFSI